MDEPEGRAGIAAARRFTILRMVVMGVTISVAALVPHPALTQTAPPGVLVRSGDEGPHGTLRVDRGASGAWQKLMQAGTTASVLYTAGHPDDEEAGVLTLLARGMGVRTALLTLNRGEGGANAIGPELFDALGLIRTEELRLAGRYYGLADQYFTTAVDYGYSKTLSEAMRSWDRETLLADMVRVIRTNRPLVVVSRWHGSERDGHGHHQAAGVLTPEAVEAAADPRRFPEQIQLEGLRPWRVPKLYRGRLTADEPHDVQIDPHLPSPWLGDSYQGFGAYGLSLQRSQTAGRVRASRGPGSPARYQRLRPATEGTPESGLFDGLDTTLPGLGALTGTPLPPRVAELLSLTHREIEAAVSDFDFRRPAASAPALARALTAIREARGVVTDSDTDFFLAVEERQIADALIAAAGVELFAGAVPQGAPPGTTMAAAVPGSRLDVHVEGTASTPDAELVSVSLHSPRWSASHRATVQEPLHQGVATTLPLTIPETAEPDRPWYYRADIRSNRYLVRDSVALRRGGSPPAVAALASMRIAGVLVDATLPVVRLEGNAPFGTLHRTLDIVPPLSLRLSPGVVVRRPGHDHFTVAVEVTSHAAETAEAVVEVLPPEGWTTSPTARTLRLGGAEPTATLIFELAAPPRDGGGAGPTPSAAFISVARATVRAGGRTWTEGFQLIAHRDLRPRRLYRPAELTIAEVDVSLPDGLEVGYVMGAGDEVPAAIEQLGAQVTLLDSDDLGGGELSRYATIMIGTRAYAVRPDLVANNERLMSYARDGGNLVVLYQTPEYDPEQQAPVTASLPNSAEEVSEEDAVVRILAPGHPMLTTPNRITAADFDGWIEQRGSKFFTLWSDAYTALVESHDEGQAPQRGIWLTAPAGDGRFTYVALALQRQLPYGVPGAYRILANLLTPGR